ncbi:hypothetical protein C1A38_05390 [Verrucosispora sp. ts21]|uniref:hypothetical protein n=1 Tax=Verrucosispora sp. ts21 TaxID=2069341 RepID=UPI000C8856CA|nr:hypothetical protein [Verrucosispora sp. ts21]PMR62167.1 hypothetical protein C1A38_05390 [Verrucosispora sp. ts21]
MCRYDRDAAASAGVQEPIAASAAPPDPLEGVMLRVLYVSIRGDRSLVGGPTLAADADVPADVGTRFGTVEDIERYVARELRGLSVYWQVQVVDGAGEVVCRGFRSGYNGTGEHWTWRPES